jgi:hypothetical protein
MQHFYSAKTMGISGIHLPLPGIIKWNNPFDIITIVVNIETI